MAIEEAGSTSLVQDGGNYFLYSVGGLSGPELKYSGAPVVAGQFELSSGVWVPIGAEQTTSGYVVAWKVTDADQYTVWYTDNNGNYIANIGVVSGTSAVLQSFETTFQQDLNDDGLIGPAPSPTEIESDGSTSLVQVGNNYFLYPVGGLSGPELKYSGAPVVADQFELSGGVWVPIGAEETTSGYVVAWKVTGADQYTVWYTDSNGNYTSDIGVVSGTSAVLQSFETTFQQDLNDDGLISQVIEEAGSTSLVQDGGNYFLYSVGGLSGPELKYSGAPVVAGQFELSSGVWVPIGAEQTTSGYVVAWKVTGTDQYTVWYTNSDGNYISNIGVVSGTSAVLQSFETTFQQDLNDDGLIGPAPSPTEIESDGSTSLVQVGSNYFVYPVGGLSGPELKYSGAPVVADQFELSGGVWVPIGAEETTSGYVVAWKVTGADQYTVWYTDSNGNYTSDIGVVSGTSAVLQSFETTFQQDLNDDGLISQVIEEAGSTSLVQVGSNYFLYPNSGPAAVLSYSGAPVVAGQFELSGGVWVPIGAEETTSGYVVAWKVTGADQYTVWYTDSNGNYISNIGVVSGTSAELQSFEVTFQQDLNDDGLINQAIEEAGSTSLVQDGGNYFLYSVGGLSGPELKYSGAPVVAGQFELSSGVWVPIGAEQTTSGYVVAWKVTGTDQYTVWYTNSDGNYISNIGVVSGTSAVLQSFETTFQQDLNDDGLIGPAPSPTEIESDGSTSLVQVGSNYFVYPVGGLSGPELKYSGAPVVADQFELSGGVWVPIGAEETTSGYVVAWKVTGADQYTVWYTDSNGNYTSDIGVVSGTSAVLQSFETTFQQDLNDDGLISSIPLLPQFVYQSVDGTGVQLYDVMWNTLGGLQPFAVRVLAPDHPSTDYEHNFLFALPVQAGLAQSTWGSGLDELQQLDVQNQYNATIIEPIFPIDPWYADSATDATINYETFMATFLPEWIDSTFATSGTEDKLLIGFSKSGYGGLDILFQHPSVFDAVAAWDFPADMAAYTEYGASGNYGTDANFQNNYRLTDTFIDTWKAPFTTENRIWISGYDVFQTDVADFDALLTSDGVMHTLLTQTYDAHSWSGGWLPDAVAGLYGLVNGDTSNVLMGLASNDVLTGGAGVDTFEFESQFGNVTITDFDASEDVIQFNPALFANYSAVIASTQQNGANTIITFDANDTITLTNVATASVSPANFGFA